LSLVSDVSLINTDFSCPTSHFRVDVDLVFSMMKMVACAMWFSPAIRGIPSHASHPLVSSVSLILHQVHYAPTFNIIRTLGPFCRQSFL